MIDVLTFECIGNCLWCKNAYVGTYATTNPDDDGIEILCKLDLVNINGGVNND